MNIGAASKPIEGAYHIDLNPSVAGVHVEDTTNLSNIALGDVELHNNCKEKIKITINEEGEQSHYIYNGFGDLVANEWIIAKNAYLRFAMLSVSD